MMKRNIIASFLTLVFLSYIAFSFIPQAKAQTVVTSPVTFFSTAIKGNITYQLLGGVFGGLHHIVPSVGGLTITIENFFNHQSTYTGTTDATGFYEVSVPNGLYDVSVKSSANTFFTPPFAVVTVQNDDATANFQGLIFPSFK